MSNATFKLVSLSKRKDGMTPEDFIKHTMEVHVPLVLNIPGVRRYTQNFVQHGVEPAPFDLVTEVWFDNEAEMEMGFASEEAKAAFADVPLFISEIHSFPVQEVKIRE